MGDYVEMVRIPVQSRILKTIAYDVPLRILELEYKSGSIYRFYDIPEELFRESCTCSSPGRHVEKYLKAHRVRSRKVG